MSDKNSDKAELGAAAAAASAEKTPPKPDGGGGDGDGGGAAKPGAKLSMGGMARMASSLKNLSKAAAQRVLAQKDDNPDKKKRDSQFWSDCDSEGNDPPPGGVYVDPSSIDDSNVPPPRTNDPIKLPFFKPRERPRLRDAYASKISYEDWIEDDAENVGGEREQKSRAIVEKLEPDSDFPVGRAYFWHSFCPKCSTTYYPHVPGAWACVRCKDDGDTRTWQQPSDPESRHCAVCKREVSSMLAVGGHRLRNPMALNAHLCKRCGRVVCDSCYSPIEADLDEWGFKKKQHICTRCIGDLEMLQQPPPEEEDLGTLHDEIEGGTDDQQHHVPFWAPKCTSCNVTFGQPPMQWLCTRCGRPVWQPKDAPESAKCWCCNASNPKVRCHKCGQLACNACGSYGQPLPELGWYEGNFMSVCRACYGGVAARKQVGANVFDNSSAVSAADAGDGMGGVAPFAATCSSCKKPQGMIPKEWRSTCHGGLSWQRISDKGGDRCAVCDVPIQSDTSDNCRRCGRLTCVACVQYREPVPDRGFDKTKAQPVCRGCFGAHHLYEIDATDLEYWPPRCTYCKRNYPKPPDRWRCPMQCGNLVWQPLEHIRSKCCWACGKKVSSGIINCRKCGRIACRSCEQRAEVVVRGFTKGVEYPVCARCCPPKTKEELAAEEKAKKDEEEKKKKEEKERKEKAKPTSPARGKTPGKRPQSPGGKGKRPASPGKKPAGKPGGKGSPARGQSKSPSGRQGSPAKPGSKPGGKPQPKRQASPPKKK